MKFRILALLFATTFVVLSCGEDIDKSSSTVEVIPFASTITKGSPDGTLVPDPLANTGTITIDGDFANFNLAITNNNDNSLVVTGIELELVDYNDGASIKTASYPAQSYAHCAQNFPDSLLGGRFFAFMPTGSSVNLGSYNNSLFYIENLVEDEFGRYKVEVTLTVRGFFTEESALVDGEASPETCSDADYVLPRDPYLQNVGPFKKIVFFQLF